MRVALTASRLEKGNTLLVALFTMVIIGFALITYLQLGLNETQLVTRSQVWNACMPLLEAGIEEALEHCTFNASNMASNGWILLGSRYYRTNTLGEGYCVVSIGTNQPTDIISTGNLPMPGSAGYVSRTVRVLTTNATVFNLAMVSKTFIRMNGNNTLVDSYDSRDPAKSTNGQYDPAKAGDKADVACVTSKGGNFSIGNGNIWGHGLVEAGGSVSTGPNGALGSVGWQKGGKGGVQSGWLRTDLNIHLPDVTAPFASGTPPAPGNVDGNPYDYVFTTGNYLMATLDKQAAVTGKVVVYMTGKINSQTLYIKTNASLTLYCGGTDASFNKIVNPSATQLIYFGMPANTSLSLGSDWQGAVYAPNADFSVAGSSDYYGSITVRSITLKGNAGFHYDEALGSGTNSRPFIATAWTEL